MSDHQQPGTTPTTSVASSGRAGNPYTPPSSRSVWSGGDSSIRFLRWQAIPALVCFLSALVGVWWVFLGVTILLGPDVGHGYEKEDALVTIIATCLPKILFMGYAGVLWLKGANRWAVLAMLGWWFTSASLSYLIDPFWRP
ncbi:hypothetical protein Pan216_22380 [Planctomycetes bacterium Pan216]|uniref:Uncharacterized protein n=1 Tax=Kolteria novifilia TaxID=2527975 RepID=A0A518B365_9BACT|nr:hypothetical protein Pan216_22380 [Planctomycetes bacterium Pan216]